MKSHRSSARAAPHSADALGFDRRQAGDPPIFNQDVGLGDPLPPHEIASARHAALKKAEEGILVRAIRRDGEGTYSGEIYGFEPHHGVELNGLRLGDRIVFREEHVFTCGR